MNNRSSKRDDKIDRQEAARMALIVSGLFWALLVIGASFDDEFNARLRGVLGDEPNGLKFDLYILLTTLQLSIPLVFFLYHAFVTLTYAREYRSPGVHAGDAGAFVGLVGYLRYLVRDTGEGPLIRRSKLITFAGIIYLLGLFAWWIWWTDKQGI
jgi:hypothetical protein